MNMPTPSTQFVVSELGAQLPIGKPLLDRVADAEFRRPPARPEMPQFKRPWWLRKKYVDIQPMIWSLYNRPDEWVENGPNHEGFLTHQPSGHHVFVARKGQYRISSLTRCGCADSGRRFSWVQQRQFHDALTFWRQSHNPSTLRGSSADQHFASHFA